MIKKFFFEISGQRVDKAITDELDSYSRSEVSRWIKEGLVKVNGSKTKASNLTQEGEEVTIDIPEEKDFIPKPEDIKLDIIYEDEDIIVINKEQGMVVHPGAGNPSGTLVNALLHHTNGRLSKSNGLERQGIVHRLDKDTSGLLVCSKTEEAYSNLQKQFQNHEVEKIYEAIVHGEIKEKSAKINAPIARDPLNRQRMAIVADGKSAVSYFRVLSPLEKSTYIELNIITGRTHQIRVHMTYIKHPLVGDSTYAFNRDKHGNGQFLHAKKLKFTHPTTGEMMEFEVEAPQEFKDKLDELHYQESNRVQWDKEWNLGEIDEQED